jgi:hypothetical protein
VVWRGTVCGVFLRIGVARTMVRGSVWYDAVGVAKYCMWFCVGVRRDVGL